MRRVLHCRGRHRSVYLLAKNNGTIPLLTLFERLCSENPSAAETMLGLLEKVTNIDPLRLPPGTAHQLHDVIWQFRKGDLRVLYFIYLNDVHCTHGFIKKTNKTPQSEIDQAVRFKKAFFAEIGRENGHRKKNP